MLYMDFAFYKAFVVYYVVVVVVVLDLVGAVVIPEERLRVRVEVEVPAGKSEDVLVAARVCKSQS